MIRVKAKHNRVRNINLILRKLLKSSSQGGSTLEDLAQLCNVSERHVYRYLRDIENMGFELIRPQQIPTSDGGKGRYRLSDKTIQASQGDISLMLLIGLYTQKEIQYRQQLLAIYEVFVRNAAAKNGIILPINWNMRDKF